MGRNTLRSFRANSRKRQKIDLRRFRNAFGHTNDTGERFWKSRGALGMLLERPWDAFGRILTPFWPHVGAVLALSWGTWAQALALDGLVGLREALRIT